MKHFIILLLVVFLCVGLSANTNLRIGGHFRTRYYYGNESAGRTDFTVNRVWLTINGNLAENVFGMIAMENEWHYGKQSTAPYAPNQNTNPSLAYGFLTVNNVFIEPLSITFGRQPFRLNKNNLLLWDAGDGLDGIKLTYKADAFNIDLINFQTARNSNSTKDSRIYGLVANFKVIPHQNIQVYYLIEDYRKSEVTTTKWDFSDTMTINGDTIINIPKEKTYVTDKKIDQNRTFLGIRAEGRIMNENSSYIAEMILQGGKDEVTNKDYDASLFYIAGTYEFPHLRKLKLIGDYIFISGDNSSKTSKNQGFGTGATLHLPWTEGANNFDWFAKGVRARKADNIEGVGIGASFVPRDKLTASFKYTMFTEQVSGNDLANVLDLKLHYQFASNYWLTGFYSLVDYDDSDKDDGAHGGLEFRINF